MGKKYPIKKRGFFFASILSSFAFKKLPNENLKYASKIIFAYLDVEWHKLKKRQIPSLTFPFLNAFPDDRCEQVNFKFYVIISIET